MARRTTETLDDWVARNGMTARFTKVNRAEKAVGFGPGYRQFKAELDRDGADAKLIVDWFERAADVTPTNPVPVMEDLRDICLDVALVGTNAAAVKAKFVLETEGDWKRLLNDMADIRARVANWLGPVEFAKLIKTAEA